MNNIKMAVVKWYDPDTCDSVRIAADEYRLSIKAIEATGKSDEIWVCVTGAPEDVDRFVNDVDEGDVEPFDCTCNLTDDEYQDWLVNKLRPYGILYIPSYDTADDGEDDDAN